LVRIEYAEILDTVGFESDCNPLGFENGEAGFGSVLAPALGVHSSAAAPRPVASSLMPLRCAHQVPDLRTGMVWCHTVDRPLSREYGVGMLQYKINPIPSLSWEYHSPKALQKSTKISHKTKKSSPQAATTANLHAEQGVFAKISRLSGTIKG
jgi:hypothetical protein